MSVLLFFMGFGDNRWAVVALVVLLVILVFMLSVVYARKLDIKSTDYKTLILKDIFYTSEKDFIVPAGRGGEVALFGVSPVKNGR